MVIQEDQKYIQKQLLLYNFSTPDEHKVLQKFNENNETKKSDTYELKKLLEIIHKKYFVYSIKFYNLFKSISLSEFKCPITLSDEFILILS